MPGKAQKRAPLKTIALKPKSGEYVTDGKELWRIEVWLPAAEGVILEEARSGDSVCWTLAEFAQRSLRVVKRAR